MQRHAVTEIVNHSRSTALEQSAKCLLGIQIDSTLQQPRPQLCCGYQNLAERLSKIKVSTGNKSFNTLFSDGIFVSVFSFQILSRDLTRALQRKRSELELDSTSRQRAPISCSDNNIKPQSAWIRNSNPQFLLTWRWWTFMYSPEWKTIVDIDTLISTSWFQM